MKLARQIKDKLLIRSIRKTAGDRRREKVSLNFQAMQRIAMLVDGSQRASILFAKKYADNWLHEGKSIELLAYVPKREKAVTYSLPYFTDEDLNWFRKPNKASIDTFMETPFDLLINFSPVEILPLEYICAHSAAKYIIGNGTQHLNNYYDCLIMVNDADSPDAFMENVHHYLNLHQHN